MVPNYAVNFILIGSVKLKYIAILLVLMDFLNIKSDNPGGHIAHIGGALFGFIYVSQMKKGKDISKGFNRLLNIIVSLFKAQPPKMRTIYSKKPKTDEEYNFEKAREQKHLDNILDKISKSGYESLTKEEKDFLFNISNDKKE